MIKLTVANAGWWIIANTVYSYLFPYLLLQSLATYFLNSNFLWHLYIKINYCYSIVTLNNMITKIYALEKPILSNYYRVCSTVLSYKLVIL